MKSSIAAALAALLFSVCALAPAFAAETFIYRLIPENNVLHYFNVSHPGTHLITAGVSGTLQFILNDDDTITTTGFDLTIEGPFDEGLDNEGPSETAHWAPFAPGDKLANYLAIDFTAAEGFKFAPPGFNGQPEPPRAIVGPDVSHDGAAVSIGSSYYQVNTLDINPTQVLFAALARADIGGAFSLLPKFEIIGISPGSGPDLGGDVIYVLHRALPQAVRIPEPATLSLLLTAAACLRRRRREEQSVR